MNILARNTSRNGGIQNWQYKIAQWMQGRYGIDECTQALMIAGCVLVVIHFFIGSSLISLLSLLCFIVGIARMLSRNYSARRRELEKYQQIMEKPKAWWRLTNKRYENRHTTMYFKCKGCGTILNVPKGKGKLLVTCPKCGTKVEKKS